jgi:Protein of unknown function (DUF1194)
VLVDVSGSVDANEYNLQKTGYVNAFNSAAVQNAILGSEDGAIAVTYIEWSGPTQQAIQVGWTLINSVASAQAFATALNGVSRAFAGNTPIQDAIGKSYTGFGTEVGAAGNGFESPRQVIDVSGDGADNASTTFCAAGCGRNAALAAGVDTINGIAILGETGCRPTTTTSSRAGPTALSTWRPVSTLRRRHPGEADQGSPDSGSGAFIAGSAGSRSVHRRCGAPPREQALVPTELLSY